MRILVLHNHYRLPGGEDSVVRDEIRLLRERHNEVYYYEKTNREIDDFPLYRKIGAALHIKYSKQSYMDVKTIIHKFRPDVAHFHNIFFMITPSAYFACKEAKVPVVQTMHNFRLFSPTGLLFPNSVDPKDYKECQYGFFRKKVIERMLRYHWRLNTWNNYVDQYIVLSEFARQQYMEAGIIPEKLIIKPNFVFSEEKNISRGDYILYVGRLSK
ncbi:MAG: glycosyltransferase family 4 protein, partial [Candidatus Omnitrophica bacterium]|nr:glycosyltransferase family 4 protein [Candidatus Omnitrophota bacterium]